MVLPIALAAAGSSLLGGIGGILGGGAKKKQTKNALRAFDLARDQGGQYLEDSYETASGRYTPYAELGAEGAAGVRNMLSPDFEYTPSDPSYGFRLREGENALARRQAAGGGFLTGGGVKAALRYNQDYASTEFGNDFSRRFGVAGLGAQVANQQAGTDSAYGQNRANLLLRVAEGKAPIYSERGDAIAGQFGSAFGGLQGAIGSYFGF